MDTVALILTCTTLSAVVLIVIRVSMSWTRRRGAQWVPSSMARVRMMLEMANVGPEDVVLDPGCGDGRLIVAAARRYGASAIGIEIDPLRFAWCQVLITVLGLRKRVQVRYGDLFEQSFSEADVVICYLLPDTNVRLQQKLVAELRPDARIVSHAFPFPDLRLAAQEERQRLFRYEPRFGSGSGHERPEPVQ